jgi:hypothetical protein
LVQTLLVSDFPAIVKLATLYSYVNGLGLFLIGATVIGFLMGGWQVVFAFHVANALAFVVEATIDFWQSKRSILRTGRPFHNSERAFYSAYQLHAARIGATADIELSDGELEEDHWGPTLYRFAMEWPMIVERFLYYPAAMPAAVETGTRPGRTQMRPDVRSLDEHVVASSSDTVPLRRWGPLARFLLLAFLFVIGLNGVAMCLTNEPEMILDAFDTAARFASLLAIYRFRRWGFYAYVAVCVLSIVIRTVVLLTYPHTPLLTERDILEIAMLMWALTIVYVAVIALVVRSRWSEMGVASMRLEQP